MSGSALTRRPSRRVLPAPRRSRAATAAVAALTVLAASVLAGVTPPTPASARTVGQGFTVTPADLAHILQQIKIAEAHVAGTTSETGPCGALLGPGPHQVPDALTSYGLRTVDGSCNNLLPGREAYGAADQRFPRLTTPTFADADERSPYGPPGRSSYQQKSGSVVDHEPRQISNLVVDQTSANPAAVEAAGHPVRSQNAPGTVACTTDPDPQASPPVAGEPAGCVPTGETLFIPNVTTDVGLSPAYNSVFTLFGQFFDHGIDQTVKGGGTVFMPLRADDPLRTVGPDGKAGTGDEVPARSAFMVLTRAKNEPGPDGKPGTADDVQEALNTDSPFVDQSQTYTSHPSHQVFLREYTQNSDGRPVSTGKLLGGPAGPTAGGMATWATVKEQAAELLGLRLSDRDVLDVPQLAVDPYGKFLPGPERGLPMYVTPGGLVEGDTADPVPVPADALHFSTPFLTDIAHHADPSPQDHDHRPQTAPVAPAPDDDRTASADFARQAPGTYDDEMLDAHFIAGDGRVNENIGLTAIHQVFHSEHDRLVGEFQKTLTDDTSVKGRAALAEWKLATGAAGWNGERLFQAARFVAEMEYQHIVFEEFGRKIQPGLDPFRVYHSDVDPAVRAEFAHAVYRFGHSMLTETIARTGADGSDNSVSLLDGFLNPPAYTDGGAAGDLTSEEAAGSIVMGMRDQVGNELDEFMTETLRSNLVGLPLDLAATNIARARETGVPSLNQLRRQLFESTGDAQLTPYTSWADFGQNVKHPASVVNFVAAYGTFPSITEQTTDAGRRKAAQQVVDPGPGVSPSPEALDFLNSTGSWADRSTGLEDVDLWVGGLAEKTNLFGGLLGSTFNHVFENQMLDLQNGDRFYYLARTPGMNLRAQLEGGSFAELIMRNTDGTHTLKADVFATADCQFQLAELAGTPAGYASSGPVVTDDPGTECDEAKLLLRKPDGTLQYRERNSVDPSGINGQAVYNGTAGVDRVAAGNDNDTVWGGEGDDVLEGQGGDDVVLGGGGDDRITDLAGADVPKGGPGDDYLNAGAGLDILMGGEGQDFTNGGANDNETFAGPGHDFVQSGDGSDVTFGDDGDDWIQGGSGQDLLIGDHGAPFFDDPGQTDPGDDVLVGQVGENDYDAEGGDDVMSANAAVDRYAGSAGFDWVTHQYDTVGADDDLQINRLDAARPLPVIVNRDRWQELEAVSGSTKADVIRGDDVVPRTVGGGGFTGCDVLDRAGIDRIAGLGEIVPAPTAELAPVEAASAPGQCPLEGPVWGEGNILLGGLGADTLEGRGADDILDGDRYLRVRISVRDDAGTEIGSTDLMERPYRAGSSRTLAADVAAGVVDPGNLVIVREVVTPTAEQAADQRDSAVFSDVEANYTVTTTGGDGTLGSPGSVTTVTHHSADEPVDPPVDVPVDGGTDVPVDGGVEGETEGEAEAEEGPEVDADDAAGDGTDTLRNIERLVFADSALPAAPQVVGVVAGDGEATVELLAPAGSVTGLTVRVLDSAGAQVGPLRPVPAGATSVVVTGLTNGTSYAFAVSATNAEGTSPWSDPSAVVVPGPVPSAEPTGTPSAEPTGTPSAEPTATPSTEPSAAPSAEPTGTPSATPSTGVTPTPAARVPGAPSAVTATAGRSAVTVRWSPPGSDGGSAVTGYTVRAYAGGVLAGTATTTGGATSLRVPGLRNGTSYTVDVRATNGVGTGPASRRSATVTPRSEFVPPVVRETSPRPGATGVRRDALVRARTSEPVTGITSATARLTRVRDGARISVAVRLDRTGQVLTLDPTRSLASRTRYQVTLGGGAARDRAGNPLVTHRWTFTTGTRR